MINLKKDFNLSTYELEKAKRIANHLFEMQNEIINPFVKIGFDFDGQWIVHPWMDSTARIDFSDEDMVNEYGTENIKNYMKQIEKVSEVIIKYNGVSPNSEEIEKMKDNFVENYSEFADFMYASSTAIDMFGNFEVVWKGFFINLSNNDVNELQRLTHHAEGFYEGTEVEYTHIEVFIDGKWYGKYNLVDESSEKLEKIAKDILGIPSLTTKDSNKIDSYQIEVSAVKEALLKAFELGKGC